MAEIDEVKRLLLRWQSLVARRQALVVDVEREIADVEAKLQAYGGGDASVLFAEERARLAAQAPRAAQPPPPPAPPVQQAVELDVTGFLFSKIRQKPLLEYGECAREFFGEDSRHNRKRIRQALFVMHKKKLIKHLFHRTWAVTDRGEERGG